MDEIAAEVFGSFPGVERTILALDVAQARGLQSETCKLHDEEARADEVGLFDRKWFDYRFLHPARATYLYAHYYREIYRRMTRKHVDHRKAEWVSGARGDVFDGKETTGFWKGRRQADEWCMPYDLYIALAFEKAMTWKRPYLPRPAQLYSDQIKDYVFDKWVERMKTKVYLAKDPRYKLDRFQGAPAQLAHMDWVLDQAALREQPHVFLAGVLYRHPMIDEERVEARFGSDMVDRCRREQRCYSA